MSIAFHPDVVTLMGFSAGTLDEPFAVVVAAHVAMCEACRETLRRTDLIGGALLASQPDAPMGSTALDRLMEAVSDDRADIAEPPAAPPGLPLPLARYLPDGLEGVKWTYAGPGMARFVLPASGAPKSRLLLYRIAGGRRLLEHGHGGQELTLVLKGAYRDRFGLFAAGDVADHDQDAEHEPTTEPGQDCICLVAIEGRLSFRSWLVRSLQPLLGF